MKHPYSTTPEQARPSLKEISRWPVRLFALHARLAPYFARAEPRHHALLYLQAVLSDIPRKNGWQIAEHAKQARPYGMQRLLARAVWDEAGVRDELRRFLCQALTASDESAPPFPLLVLDESGFLKRGRHSAGVGKQHYGPTGDVRNCQVGVFLSYVTKLGHGLIDRELYLPEDWCADPARRLAAHIPETVRFQTKPELAQVMVQRAQAAGLSIGWVVADTVYGHCPELRAFLEAQGYAYALAVPSIEVICVQTPTGCLLNSVAHIAHEALGQEDWQRLSQSLGTKGERLFDWAILPWMQAAQVDGRHFLVVRRDLDKPDQLDYYLVFAPEATTLATIVEDIGARWHVEEDLQTNKALGLDESEVRRYVGWYRHITLVMLAAAFLVALCVEENAPRAAPQDAPVAVAAPPVIALTPREVHHLLARLIWPAPTSAPLLCQWSWWRRVHQYWAGYYHRRRRQKIVSALA
jgi:SRSO17 transposase